MFCPYYCQGHSAIKRPESPLVLKAFAEHLLSQVVQNTRHDTTRQADAIGCPCQQCDITGKRSQDGVKVCDRAQAVGIIRLGTSGYLGCRQFPAVAIQPAV